jgi:predicted  nucleic acid-binding Zn-ribbon protein
VPTQEVTKISQKDITQELINNNFSTIQKIRQIKEQGLIKVKGEWCRGCTAQCQHKEAGHITKTNGSLRDYSDFIKNVNIVAEKVIRQLELEFGND